MNGTAWWDFCHIACDGCNDCPHRDKKISLTGPNAFGFCTIATQNQFMLIEEFVDTKCVRSEKFKLISKMKKI